jgi:hypothetical protein
VSSVRACGDWRNGLRAARRHGDCEEAHDQHIETHGTLPSSGLPPKPRRVYRFRAVVGIRIFGGAREMSMAAWPRPADRPIQMPIVPEDQRTEHPHLVGAGGGLRRGRSAPHRLPTAKTAHRPRTALPPAAIRPRPNQAGSPGPRGFPPRRWPTNADSPSARGGHAYSERWRRLRLWFQSPAGASPSPGSSRPVGSNSR